MDTALKTDEEKKEFFDSEFDLDKKCTKLADMIRKSEYFIAFTGAGISTSTGIPDFRSGKDTVLKTGPGAWEKRALNLPDNKSHQRVDSLKAIPSPTHMALLQLEKYSLLKFLISQNTDGLHRRSGFPPEKLAELHGNTNMEICSKCKKKYLRDFRTRTANAVHDHKTGKKCEQTACGGDLEDSIINFGENLPEKDLDNGFIQSQLADVCLVLGSSLRVTPAANMPETVGLAKKNLVIVNLQSTPYDKIAALTIHGLCDDVMQRVMKKLEIPIPEFVLKRRFCVKKVFNQVEIRGTDSDFCPYQLFKSVEVEGVQSKQKQTKQQLTLFKFDLNKDDKDLKVKLEFFGHYKETPYSFQLNYQALDLGDTMFLLQYDPKTLKWMGHSEVKFGVDEVD